MSATTTMTDAHYELPTTTAIQEAGDLPLLDENGNSIPLKSLWTGENASGRQLIIFVRHFYCGLCEAYVRELNQELPQTKLDTLTPPVKLTIIGCGQLPPLQEWKRRSECSFPVYCDPSRKIYARLGMVENLSMGGRKPDYLKVSAFSTTMTSAWNAITAGPSNSLKAGNFAQNGGELLFESGELKWCHRMKNTRDHAEVSELKQVLKI
ncbi:hypothetical protein AMS68_001151 [Peltaster fructicola]|uniref:Thioredoxin domain-containing protein n=1 Tax=Peltaster fructicola TaxID=286661 RepID=A0A6H0XLN2_9PEZI|nr:hypothetical protein AMS68_001151 [Peltaster fructicola]